MAFGNKQRLLAALRYIITAISCCYSFDYFCNLSSISKTDASPQSNNAASPTGTILAIAFRNPLGASNLYIVRASLISLTKPKVIVVDVSQVSSPGPKTTASGRLCLDDSQTGRSRLDKSRCIGKRRRKYCRRAQHG